MRVNLGDHIGFQAFALFLIGVFLVALAIMDASFLFDHPKARSLVGLFGRVAARIVCAVLGLFLAGLAYWVRLAFE